MQRISEVQFSLNDAGNIFKLVTDRDTASETRRKINIRTLPATSHIIDAFISYYARTFRLSGCSQPNQIRNVYQGTVYFALGDEDSSLIY